MIEKGREQYSTSGLATISSSWEQRSHAAPQQKSPQVVIAQNKQIHLITWRYLYWLGLNIDFHFYFQMELMSINFEGYRSKLFKFCYDIVLLWFWVFGIALPRISLILLLHSFLIIYFLKQFIINSWYCLSESRYKWKQIGIDEAQHKLQNSKQMVTWFDTAHRSFLLFLTK